MHPGIVQESDSPTEGRRGANQRLKSRRSLLLHSLLPCNSYSDSKGITSTAACFSTVALLGQRASSPAPPALFFPIHVRSRYPNPRIGSVGGKSCASTTCVSRLIFNELSTLRCQWVQLGRSSRDNENSIVPCIVNTHLINPVQSRLRALIHLMHMDYCHVYYILYVCVCVYIYI